MNANAFAYEAERENRVRDKKPVLAGLVDSFRRAADVEQGERRDRIEGMVVYFGSALSDARYSDVTQDEADATRATWGIRA